MVLLEIFFDGLVRLSPQSSPNLRSEPGKTVLSCRGRRLPKRRNELSCYQLAIRRQSPLDRL